MAEHGTKADPAAAMSTAEPMEQTTLEQKISQPVNISTTEAPVVTDLKTEEPIQQASKCVEPVSHESTNNTTVETKPSISETTLPDTLPVTSAQTATNTTATVPDPSIAVPEPIESASAQAPDPDEDELDDLDDVLDEFANTKIGNPPAAAPVSSLSEPGQPIIEATRADAANPTTTNIDEDEFAQELQKGMADLLGELESSPEMQKQFEDMIREMGKGLEGGIPGGGVDLPGTTAKASDAGKPEASFQETIKKTMERMQESGEAAGQAAANSSTSEADFMASLLKEMEAGGGGGSDEDFSKMLMGMMEQLTNKEILYEPMKELDSKFPGWMEKNKDKTPEAEMKRFKAQQTLVREIVAKFDEPGYSDDKVECREYILDRMQRMQNEGSPPSDLVGDMDAAQDALGEMDAGCPTQ